MRHEIWRLRKALPSQADHDFLLTDDIVVSFNGSAEYWLDVAVLQSMSQSASTANLIQALSLYQGELLPGFYDEWVVLERERLQLFYDENMTRLLERLEQEHQWHKMLEWAERWISSTQSPEAAYRALITAYEALGNRAQAAVAYERYVQALGQLGLAPSEDIRNPAFDHRHSVSLPIPLTSFIGRDTEIRELAELISSSRLVTLTGVGGIGKTRLAIQVVSEVLDRFPDGVWFLDLAPLNDPRLVPRMLASLLGLHESRAANMAVTDLLINYFRTRCALIIFDNCEHLIEAGAQLIYLLLSSCPHLSVLTTSREALRVSGEISYPVPSLKIPKLDQQAELATLEKAESVQLFIARAAAESRGFRINAENAFTIAQICKRLDGIPLAIELAAARINMLTVEQVLQRLDDRFKLLTGGRRTALPRHQTLWATVEWSYSLLPEKERILFRRLAVFTGGWTLEGAENVCSGDGIQSAEILNLLSQLVNKSLVVVERRDGEVRYRRLEIIREFAREKLEEATEAGRIQDRHLAFYLNKVEEIEPHLMGHQQSVWMDWLEIELDNIRAAMEWALLNKKAEESLRLIGSLGWFCFIHCHFREGLGWFERALQLRAGASKKVQAKAIADGSWLNYALGDLATASARRQESANLYRELGDLKGLSTQLQFVGVVERERGHSAQARQFLEESLRISRAINNRGAMPRVLMHLGLFSQFDGDHATAWHYFEESLAICRELGEGHLTMVVLGAMGSFALAQEDICQARKLQGEALEIGIKLKNKRTTAEKFVNFAEILCAEKRYAESAQLQGFAETLFNESESLTDSHLEDIKKSADVPIKHLGEESYWREFDVGKKLNLKQAVEIALKESAEETSCS